MVVVVDDLADVGMLERVADVVRDHVDGLDDLDVAEIFADVRRERVERVARTADLDAVAVLLVDEHELSLANGIVDVVIRVARLNLGELIVRRRAIQRETGEDAHDARRILRRREGQVLRRRLRVNFRDIAARRAERVRIGRIDTLDAAGREVDDALVVGIEIRDNRLERLALEAALLLHPGCEVFLILRCAGRMTDVVPLDRDEFLEDVRLIE